MQPPTTPLRPNAAIVDLIRAAADKARVPRQVALAFAWCESRLNPTAQGDLEWHTKKDGALYVRHVLNEPRLALNPARELPHLWHSYGLFQLMACYHCADNATPLSLLLPQLNAERGCATIARLLKHTSGNVRDARLAYVGCGYDGKRCTERHVSQVVESLNLAMRRYVNEAPGNRGAS